MAKHSRDNEREADKIGLDFLINSGYDPYEAPKVWENIIKEMKLGEVDQPISFLASSSGPDMFGLPTPYIFAPNFCAKDAFIL